MSSDSHIEFSSTSFKVCIGLTGSSFYWNRVNIMLLDMLFLPNVLTPDIMNRSKYMFLIKIITSFCFRLSLRILILHNYSMHSAIAQLSINFFFHNDLRFFFIGKHHAWRKEKTVFIAVLSFTQKYLLIIFDSIYFPNSTQMKTAYQNSTTTGRLPFKYKTDKP